MVIVAVAFSGSWFVVHCVGGKVVCHFTFLLPSTNYHFTTHSNNNNTHAKQFVINMGNKYRVITIVFR